MFYHSSYSPLKEAQRFVESVQLPYNPKIIFFLEPGLNYCLDFFKEKFPQSKIVCVRFFEETFEDEASWDYLLRYEENKNLSQALIDSFGEEKLLSSTLLIWKPAQSLFGGQINDFIKSYKVCLEACKTLLVTRQFFEKKWLINSCNFILNAQKLICPKITTSLPLVITASGPSLSGSLPIIKKNRNNLFLLCLSSSLSVLIKNDIEPDLILTTDGGYWAGQHLKYLKKHNDIPLALPVEAFVPKEILKNNKLLLLSYNDSSSFISNEIIREAELPSFEALRNPTVSGTGLFLANKLTDNKVYFCGLDLAANKAFQHSQPNELEKNNCLNDFRIKTKEARQSSSRFNSSSLQIYRNWFESLNEKDTARVCRVIPKNSQQALGNIQDIDYQNFEKEINQSHKIQNKSIDFETLSIKPRARQKTIGHVIKMLDNEKWTRQIFPADYISMENAGFENDRQEIEKRLKDKILKLSQKIRKIADE